MADDSTRELYEGLVDHPGWNSWLLQTITPLLKRCSGSLLDNEKLTEPERVALIRVRKEVKTAIAQAYDKASVPVPKSLVEGVP